MAKRFTETNKWQDPWFCGLSCRDRLFWLYLLDTCDHAGIWQVNWPLVRFYHGSDFEFKAAVFGDRIRVLTDEKWIIPKFVQYQYGSLKPDNRAHASVIALLKKEGAYKVLTSPMLGDKDKDKDKEKNKDTARGMPKRCENPVGCGLSGNWAKGYSEKGYALCEACLDEEAVRLEQKQSEACK